VDPKGALGGTWAEALDERDHELRSALCGIEVVAQGLNWQHDQLTTQQLAELTGALAAEARRMRSLLDPRLDKPAVFDLADAIRPVITSFRTMGLDVRAGVPGGIEVEGRRDDTAQVVFTVLDNARKHAAMTAVELRVAVCGNATTLYIEDDGIGITSGLGERLFERGVRGDGSAGRGLGLFIARRLMVDQDGSLEATPRTGGGTSFALGFRTPQSSSHKRVKSIPLLAAVIS
jgi:signal transduction histidine kinase